MIFRAELSDAQDDAVRRIVAAADASGRLDFLVVYGSVARGDQRADSDLDVYYETRDPAAELQEANPDSRWHVFGASSGALLESLRLGDRFAFDLLRDALVVHDDGLFRALVVAVDEEGLTPAEG